MPTRTSLAAHYHKEYTSGSTTLAASLSPRLTRATMAMLHSIPKPILARMRYLEQIDARDREDSTPRQQLLHQIPAEMGQCIALIAASAPEGAYLEIDTSVGYSTLWIGLACVILGRRIKIFEVLLEMAKLARETFQMAQVDGIVELIEGDTRYKILRFDNNIAFCFLNAEKEVYGECYELVVLRLVKSGFLVADNVISHQEALWPMLDRALTDMHVGALIIPIGKGVLICRKP